MAYYTDDQLEPVRESLRNSFSIGSLHSQSSYREIASTAARLLGDHGMEARQSLVLMLANEARGEWVSRILVNRMRRGA